MENAELIDYAYPCMMAEKQLRELHEAMLNKELDKALEHGFQALAEVKLTINAIKHAKEQNEQR